MYFDGVKRMKQYKKGTSTVQLSSPIFPALKSPLQQWPIQMHLISPLAPYYLKADVLLAADCVAYALNDFHNTYLKDNALAIACPKLDDNQEIYKKKIISWIDDAKIKSLTVMMMQIPCCINLLELTRTAEKEAKRPLKIQTLMVGIKGDILHQE